MEEREWKGLENLDEVMPPLPERRRRVRRDEAVLECAQEVGALTLREPRRVHYAVARSAQVRPHDDLRQILDALLELRLHVHVHVFCSALVLSSQRTLIGSSIGYDAEAAPHHQSDLMSV